MKTNYRDLPEWRAAYEEYVTDWYQSGLPASEAYRRRTAAANRMFEIESVRADGKPIEQPKPGQPHPGPPKPGQRRDRAVLAELDELTTRLRDGADEYARRVRRIERHPKFGLLEHRKHAAAGGVSTTPVLGGRDDSRFPRGGSGQAADVLP